MNNEHMTYTINHISFSISVYGVHRGLMCPKYVLKPDKDKNDIHYFSYLDGTIFLPNTFSTYANDHYCIENVVFGEFPENNKVGKYANIKKLYC